MARKRGKNPTFSPTLALMLLWKRPFGKDPFRTVQRGVRFGISHLCKCLALLQDGGAEMNENPDDKGPQRACLQGFQKNTCHAPCCRESVFKAE